jgi:hypothetical protein
VQLGHGVDAADLQLILSGTNVRASHCRGLVMSVVGRILFEAMSLAASVFTGTDSEYLH